MQAINSIEHLQTLNLRTTDPDPTFRDNLASLRELVQQFLVINREHIDEEMEYHTVKASQLTGEAVRAKAFYETAEMNLDVFEGEFYLMKRQELAPKLTETEIKSLLRTDPEYLRLKTRTIDLKERSEYLEWQCKLLADRMALMVNLAKRLSASEGNNRT